MPSLFKRLLLKNFHAVYRSSQWGRRHFTPTGRFLLGVLLFSGALGIDTRINLAHQLFALTLLALLLAMAWAPLYRGRFTARRILPRYATHQQPLHYRVELTNTGDRPERALHLIDQLDATPPGVEAFFHSHEPGEGRRNWFDRKVGYPRWAWLMGMRAGALEPEAAINHLPPRQRCQVDLQLTPLRRGWLHLSRLHVGRADPLGLFVARRHLDHSDRLLVLPRRYPIPHLDLPGGTRYQRGGVSLASQIGESEEFVALREYRPGDPLRKIHWKALAKTGRPITREYRDEYFVRHAMLLDTFDDTPGRTFEAAVSVAASFAARLDTRESLLDLLFVADQVHCVTAGRGVAGSDLLLETLACVTPARSSDFRLLSRSIEARAPRMSGCICILLRWDKARRTLIQHLEGGGVPCQVLLVSASHEAQPPEPGPLAGHPERLRVIHPDHLERDLGAR